MDFLTDNYITISVAFMVAVLLFIHFNLKARNANSYIGMALLAIDILPSAMAITWASSQGEDLNKLLFVLCFVAFAALKILLVFFLMKALDDGNKAGVAYVVLILLIVYGVILGGATFAGNVSGAKKAAQASLDSAPMQSLEAQIKSAETKLEGLTGFANSSKASGEAAKVARINQQLSAARTTLSNCPPNYLTKCINPAQAKIDNLENQLAGFTYSAGNDEYQGTLALLATLQERRSQLMQSGNTVSVSGSGSEDRFLAKVFSVDVDTARDYKSLVFMVVFDFITILIRIAVAFINRGVNTANLIHDQIDLYIKMGHSPEQAMLSVAQASGVIKLDKKEDSTAFNDGVIDANKSAETVANQNTSKPRDTSERSRAASESNHGDSEAIKGASGSDYDKLKPLILSGYLKATQRSIKPWMKQNKIGTSDANRQDLMNSYLDKMFNENLLQLNPANKNGINKSKYILA